jgi:hypothetical protein
MDIQRCKGCLEHFHIEKTFKDFIAAKVERKDCSEKLKQTIISQVQSNPET